MCTQICPNVFIDSGIAISSILRKQLFYDENGLRLPDINHLAFFKKLNGKLYTTKLRFSLSSFSINFIASLE